MLNIATTRKILDTRWVKNENRNEFECPSCASLNKNFFCFPTKLLGLESHTSSFSVVLCLPLMSETFKLTNIKVGHHSKLMYSGVSEFLT